MSNVEEDGMPELDERAGITADADEPEPEPAPNTPEEDDIAEDEEAG